MKLLEIFNPDNLSESDIQDFTIRRAVRGIVFDGDHNIALLHVVNHGHYSLPGGGVHNDETWEQAIIRECREELGCDTEIIHYVGTVHEYRKPKNKINETWGYVLQVIGPKGEPIFHGDEDEDEKTSEIVWVPIEQARQLLESSPYQGSLKLVYEQVCIDRDLMLLQSSK